MRSLPVRTALLLGIVAGLARPGAAQAVPAMSPRARSYLLAALDTIQAVTIRSDTISWRLIRDSAFFFAAGAERESDTYGAISWALRRANKHSFLQAPEPGAVSELLAGGLGYIHVPQRGGAGIAFADSLQRAVATLAAAGACGWIVDLRDNGGGNMWPMLAGIGPLLGDSLVGSFGTGPDAERWYYADGTSGIRHTDGTILTVLPLRARVLQACWSGEACWVPLGDVDLGVGPENELHRPLPGQLLFHPHGRSETEILVPYGVTAFAAKGGPLSGNHFLTLEDEEGRLAEIGGSIWWAGAQAIEFAVLVEEG